MMNKIYRYYALFLFCILLFIVPLVNDIDLTSFSNKTITVQIKGEVEKEELLTIDLYTTIGQVLTMINLSENADTTNINLDTILKNHDVIVIPAKAEKALVSINHGTLQQLMTLPSVGEVTAQRIIDFRVENGLFQNLSDLMKVKGIGEKTFEKLKDLICL